MDIRTEQQRNDKGTANGCRFKIQDSRLYKRKRSKFVESTVDTSKLGKVLDTGVLKRLCRYFFNPSVLLVFNFGDFSLERDKMETLTITKEQQRDGL